MKNDAEITEETHSHKPPVTDSLTYEIIGAAQKVHTVLGPGFTESTYEKAFLKELMNRKLAFESQPEFEVFYESTLCGTYRPDVVVEKTVIVELKAVSELAKEHRAQALSYLRASNLSAALLLNFGATSLQVRRLENKHSQHHQSQNPKNSLNPARRESHG